MSALADRLIERCIALEVALLATRSRLAAQTDGEALHEEALPLLPGRYGDYYAGIRDALRGVAANPVPPDEAVAVMAWLEAGLR